MVMIICSNVNRFTIAAKKAPVCPDNIGHGLPRNDGDDARLGIPVGRNGLSSCGSFPPVNILTFPTSRNRRKADHGDKGIEAAPLELLNKQGI